jgi:nicotinate-nucleotide adenylyltransferase
MKRIGIYAGTFNPVHSGHIAFALQALRKAQLDTVYFMPERVPRHKKGVEHYAHRLAMLKRATQPFPGLDVLETDDVAFTVRRTLPNLTRHFGSAQLAFLAGSDVVAYLPEWPGATLLLERSELVVGVRQGQNVADTKRQLAAWECQPKRLTLFPSYAADISSATVREALREHRPAPGILRSVAGYSNQHWLYVSVG